MQFSTLWGLLALAHTCQCSVQSSLNPQVAAIVSIQQTLALFPIAVDTKNYDLFSSVFTPNVSANFSMPGSQNIHGIPMLTASLSKGLAGLVSQHSLSTLSVNFSSPTVATSVQYLVGTFFGQGNLTGQVSSNYGNYVDTLLLQDDGSWLVSKRTFESLVSEQIQRILWLALGPSFGHLGRQFLDLFGNNNVFRVKQGTLIL